MNPQITALSWHSDSTVYPEWPHRLCVGLAFWGLRVRSSLVAASLVICSPHCTVQYVELRGTAYEGGRGDQLIGSTVSNAIVRIWLWSTETRSSPLGYFSRLLKVVDN